MRGFSPDSGMKKILIIMSNSPQPVSVTSKGDFSITDCIYTRESVVCCGGRDGGGRREYTYLVRELDKFHVI